MAIGLVTAVLLLPTVSDLAAIARMGAGRRRRRRDPVRHGGDTRPRLLFLVPAHDEELLIDSCLRSLMSLRYPADRMTVVVIADNCADRTADLARDAGARCLERRSTDRRGKPWAIAWALEQLDLNDHDAIVIVDADSVVDREFAAALAATGPLDDKAVQPYNDVSNRGENALTRMASVLSSMRFRFMNALKQRVGLNVPLANGLCVGARVLSERGWNAFSICEDWEMYAILTTRGVPIENLPTARLWSQEASSLRQSSSQRRRWTAGRLDVVARHGAALLRSPHVGRHQKLDALAELTAPGPAVHLGVVVALATFAMAFQPPGATWLTVGLGLSLARPILYTLAALRVESEPAIAARAFLYLPVYTMWRLAVQTTAVLSAGHTPWTRTQRAQIEDVTSG